MASKVTWPQLVAHIGGDEPRLIQYLKGDSSIVHPIFDRNLLIADGMMRSRITTRYTVVSYDAWDSTTIPDYIRFHLESMLLDAATSGDDNRPGLLNTGVEKAKIWLDDVESGAAKIQELNEIDSTVSGMGASVVRVGAPTCSRFSDTAIADHIFPMR